MRQPATLDPEVVVAEESHRSDDDQPHDQDLEVVRNVNGTGEKATSRIGKHGEAGVGHLDTAREHESKREDDGEVQDEELIVQAMLSGPHHDDGGDQDQIDHTRNRLGRAFELASLYVATVQEEVD